jgi:hypothetical protein
MSSITKESWARTVEVHLTKKVYPTYDTRFDGEYTGLLLDLMDTDNRMMFGAYDYGDKENISGFTIQQLEAEVYSSWNMGELKRKIVANYPLLSSTELDYLFNYWSRVPKREWR